MPVSYKIGRGGTLGLREKRLTMTRGQHRQDGDDGLRAGLAAGEAAAFERAWDLYGPGLYRCALRLLGVASDAEDAVAEVFAMLVRRRRRLEAVRDLQAYLYASLRHAAAAIARRRLSGLPGDGGAGLEASRQACGSGEDAGEVDGEQLARLLEQLPAAQREAIVLKIYGGLTFAQVAEACGLSPNTVAGRYRYGLEKLRRMLRRMGVRV